ncbi:MAG: heat-inducible transcription repressor HrcA, partial [Gammaproteobacteria bacterium]
MSKLEERPPILSDRAQHLLKILVEMYIHGGEPVGSRSLARDSGLNLSSASIRNVMADLEELGLINSPHTSSGRVPTVQGYRVFVDTLLSTKALDSEEVRRIQDSIDGAHDPGALVEAASTLLSDITHMAGLVMLPRQVHSTVRQVEFLPLSGEQVLVILVINEREVENRIIHTGRRYSASELEQAANYLNAACTGRDLKTARREILAELSQVRENLNRMMLAVVEMADKAFVTEHGRDDLLVTGQTHLLDYVDLANMDQIRQLFDAFNQKSDILHLLDQSMRADGVNLS